MEMIRNALSPEALEKARKLIDLEPEESSEQKARRLSATIRARRELEAEMEARGKFQRQRAKAK